jgi:hypothetical protein
MPVGERKMINENSNSQITTIPDDDWLLVEWLQQLYGTGGQVGGM